MKSVKIVISGTEYTLRQSFRSLIEFEKMTGKNSFSAHASITDSLAILYCMLKSANLETFKMSFDELLDELDQDPEIMVASNNFMLSLLEPEVETATEKKTVEIR